ncbi:GntR family transcriptional regulator [Novosphingobium fuchskuhlense]|uniref:GntR family transcriptional regulator n=1 Tax=Novosphingobium fuchskuhlense TaxID=1117702 RepID=A0A117USQ9_9SPHN|nr:GntR family transcriptional regulator [Novosphingobium fuchskuhlense]KUR70154.1 GntR family transcriptional regulator [Novosphingobium fuchskuhlense]
MTATGPLAEEDARTLHQQVLMRLREAILLGRIEPGQALTIRGLAAELGVSAQPVREALRQLVAERALELMDNRRVRIPPMTIERFEDLIAARVVLEAEAAARAMPYVTDTLIARLEADDAAINAAVSAGDYDRWIGANYAFHSALYGAAGQSAFLPLIESLWLQVGPFLRRAMRTISGHYTVDRHSEALAALRRRDTMALRIAIEADIRDGIAHIGSTLIRSEALGGAAGAVRGPSTGSGRADSVREAV